MCERITHASLCMCMIYGDQSQEGILLRDYFCCDTNELRLQIHCRPITLEKRLLAYYTQIISEFYPPCYVPEHLIFADTCIYRNLYMCVYACMWLYYHPAIQMDSRLLSLMLCRLYWGAPALLDLSLLHCVARVRHSAVSSVHQYATSACVR